MGLEFRRVLFRSETVTETHYYDCERFGKAEFNNVPVDGSVKMDDAYMDSIEPYDYDQMKEFSAGYLTGYLADKYDVDAESSAPRADERIKNTMLNELGSTLSVAYEGYEVKDCVVKKGEGAVKYALAPVWILSTKYQGKVYTFMMNGQTGKLVGELPVDKTKLYTYCGGSFIGVCTVVYGVLKMILG